MRCITKVALSIRGDRVEKGVEVDLTPDEVAGFDPADITSLSDIPVTEEETEEVVPPEKMTIAQLRDRAKELGLSAGGSKVEIEERIRLHLEGQTNGDPEMIDHVVTEEDLENNPELAAEGVKVGDTIQIPVTEEETEEDEEGLSEPNQ